ncbi:hypothetical protein GDO81_013140 [Engystomops pustulosus]|uniref:Uncharacterized protein n=1 Tax=Engystomops pustulosus TaxID=76066 RepID=A0AAV7B327_ENGPU|nr:hypothetical protein GDO81_013140 [Engystomops pustulosus]
MRQHCTALLGTDLRAFRARSSRRSQRRLCMCSLSIRRQTRPRGTPLSGPLSTSASAKSCRPPTCRYPIRMPAISWYPARGSIRVHVAFSAVGEENKVQLTVNKHKVLHNLLPTCWALKGMESRSAQGKAPEIS